MNDDVLGRIMDDVDPSRALTDDALDALVPHGQLMSRVMAQRDEELAVARPTPRWRRAPALVVEGCAALAVVVAGLMTILAPGPATPSWTFSVAGTAPTQRSLPEGVLYSSSSYSSLKVIPDLSPTSPEVPSTPVTSHDVVNGRFVTTVSLDDGALVVAPAPPSQVASTTVAQEAALMWATSQLEDDQPQVIGFGLATLRTSSDGIQRFTREAAFVALATSINVVHSCPVTTDTGVVPRVPSNGEAAVVLAIPRRLAATGEIVTPPSITYVAASTPCGQLARAQVSIATAQESIPWSQHGRVAHGRLPIEVWTPGCGATLDGYVVTGSSRHVTVSVRGLVYEGLVDELCPVGRLVHETLELSPTNGAGSVTGSTRITHAPLGYLRAVRS